MVKNNELRTSCSFELNKKVEEFVKDRTYPSADDYKVRLKFKNKADFIHFVMRLIVKSNQTEWDIIVNWLHPDRRF